ncbi:outer membrane lipoprotein chaperone LolA [Ideonella sp. DXS29W]|uniref:Outer-membrane lipoprotein carrier protein n=1 Tax=Ideonella lacteola TaxID=2984193 RepID=A0ABU9BK31_9BURK
MNSFRFVAPVALLLGCSGAAWADAAESLRAFVRDVKAGQSGFTQTVTSPDGKKQKVSSGQFSFSRPNKFRFDYAKPYAQTIVSDGAKVWFHDPDLNQVTIRQMGDALGNTPVALLTGSSIEKNFELKAQPDKDGLEWVQATPRESGGTIQWLKAGFKGKALAAVEISDSFGQRSLLKLDNLTTDTTPPASTFSFAIPPGADVSGP